MDKTTRAKFEANLSLYLKFSNYLSAYHEAFKALIKDVEYSGGHVDRIAYPMLFTARHCLELGFKTNIRYFSKYSKKDDFTKSGSHDLEGLFDAFRLHITETIKRLKSDGIKVDRKEIKEFNHLCGELKSFTATMALLDKGSDAFRYPVDKEYSKPSFKPGETINLALVDELLTKAMVLFYNTAAVFEKYTDYVEEIEKMYQEEMQSSVGHY